MVSARAVKRRVARSRFERLRDVVDFYSFQDGIPRKSLTGAEGIFKAVRSGHSPLVKDLIMSGAPTNWYQNGNTPLLQAVCMGHLEFVTILLAAGAGGHREGKDCNAALREAARQGYTEISRSLICAGANVNARNQDKDSALTLAVDNNHVKVVSNLIENKADVNIQRRWQQTPLHLMDPKEVRSVREELRKVRQSSQMNLKQANEILDYVVTIEDIVRLKAFEQVDAKDFDFVVESLEKLKEMAKENLGHAKEIVDIVAETSSLLAGFFQMDAQDVQKFRENMVRLHEIVEKKITQDREIIDTMAQNSIKLKMYTKSFQETESASETVF